MEKRNIFFNESIHKYTDNMGNPYISTTTLISNYYEKFKAEEIAKACEAIGRNPKHPKYLKYKNKSKKQLLYEWEQTKTIACEKGTNKHNYLEQAVRSSTGYKLIDSQFINDRIYTLDDVIGDRKIGLLNLEYFESIGLKEKYPIIFNTIYKLTQLGYLIYAEIGVYDSVNLVSGLVDIILIKNNDFIILDWKTNSAPIMFESGYFNKDNNGNLTSDFIYKQEYFSNPISYLSASTGHKYSLQLSGYANMAELFGFKYKGSILCHIRTLKQGIINSINNVENEEVKLIEVLDLRNDFQKIKEHNFNLHHFEEPSYTLF